MKRFLICFLLLALLLSGCSRHNGDGNDAGTDNNKELGTSSVYIYECEAPGVFANLTDFYKFASSGSRDPDKYIDSYTAENISWYASVEPAALLKIEDLFNDEKILDCGFLLLFNYY